MEINMKGRFALITGGSEGLGKAMALGFAQAGADVAIAARRMELLAETRDEIAQATGQRIMAYSADVSDAQQVSDLFAKVVADFGQIDVLVNNAGTSQTGKFEEVTDETWQFDIDLKLMAAVRLCRLALPGMKERHWGRIINVLNTAAKAPRGGSAPTAVTRAAGMALTKVLAGEGAAHNVLVNALCTGIIESGQWVRRHEALSSDMPMDDFLTGMAKERGVPMGRLGTAEEFANMACFLASDAGSYITGTAINVDGGLSPVV
ncbi:MAG: SDR family oxidoreductase [Rhodospirillaceae bacterium]|jgi:NAD(P)-dependent dehydrogenase (short-subunit alcohol dehydrogenase family)|nr:SDR family oxidoreductase [Rhodospirillaceae bacterium]MBT4046448.1 SDR family oxidoreductase [Rhodospirillaceae bacterium]MBT4690466.1 SDR family oxidoreductase [Rhodospirillaceae bacterium]MBT5083184.1 SDR family oxidoreductase [Rhodospirillaceae bacterium]MBT5526487.1 SDR family oxidoreductase [Rhodospirillaceae bacterium]